MRSPCPSLQISMFLSTAVSKTDLKKRLLKESPCFAPRAILNSSRSTSVRMVARLSEYSFSVSNVPFTVRLFSEGIPDNFVLHWVECPLGVHGCRPHVKWSEFRNVFPNPAWSARWCRATSASIRQCDIVEKNLRSCEKTTDQSAALWTCRTPFLEDRCVKNFPTAGSTGILFDDQIEHRLCLIVNSFYTFCFYFPAVHRFLVYDTVNFNTQFYHGEFWDVFVSFTLINIFSWTSAWSQMSSNISSLYNSPFFFFPFSKVLIFVECCKFVNNSFPRCFDVSIFVSHMRGKIVLLSCIDFRDRCSSFKLFKNVLYLLMSFGSCCLWFISNLLADVSHLGFLLSVHVFSSAVCCCSAPPTNYSLCVFVVVMCCWCSDSPIISSLLPFRRRGMPISFSCLFNRCCCMLANEPLFLFISSTCFVDSFCWLCVIFTCFHWCRLSLVSIIVAKMFHDQCCPLLTLQRMGIGNAQQLICGPSPNEPCRLPHRRYNFFCFFCEIADCWVVYLSHSQVWRWIAFQALLWMLFWAPHRSESSTTVSSSCYVCWVPPLHDFQRSDSQKQSVEIAPRWS